MDKILIIGQDSSTITKMKEAISERYRCTFCSNYEEMYDFLHHHIPEVVLIEDARSKIDPCKIIEYVKRSDELSQILMFVISSGEDTEYEKKCLHIGAHDLINLSSSAVEVQSRVHRALEYHQMKKTALATAAKRSAEIAHMKDMANRDPLTKLLNRMCTEKAINQYLLERRNCGALLMIDMDNFKEINDTYGHMVGDEILVEFANTLSALTRQDDLVCRLGGDEFIVFLKDVSCHSVIIEKVEQIIMTLEKRIQLPGTGQSITVSTGIAVAPLDGRSFTQLYQNADKSLYYVKENKKGAYRFFSEEGDSEVHRIKSKNTQVDLEHLRSFIQEVGYKKGAYQVEYDGFKKIYRFIARCIGRTNQDVQTVLFTLNKGEDYIPDIQELVFAMDNLKNAVHESIRRGDVATNYSNSQFVVILMDSTYDDAKMVAGRIHDKYDELLSYSANVDLSYDIQSIMTAPICDDF